MVSLFCFRIGNSEVYVGSALRNNVKCSVRHGYSPWTRSGFGPERELLIYLSRNPDPGFTPDSTPGFGPDSESSSVSISSNKSTEPLDITLQVS